MKLEIKKLNKYTDKTGSLVPFYSKKNFKIKRFFFYTEIKNTQEPIMLIKNVIKLLYLFVEPQKFK